MSGSSWGAIKLRDAYFLYKWDHSCFAHGSYASLMGQCAEGRTVVNIIVRCVVLHLYYKILTSKLNMTNILIVVPISYILWKRLHLWLSYGCLVWLWFEKKISTLWKNHWKPVFTGSWRDNSTSWTMMQPPLGNLTDKLIGVASVPMGCKELWHCDNNIVSQWKIFENKEHKEMFSRLKGEDSIWTLWRIFTRTDWTISK